MRLLPSLLAEPVFAPLRYFLADGDCERRLQLAERLADLFDQYQVYRADWLADWAAGRNVLKTARGEDIEPQGRTVVAAAAVARRAMPTSRPRERDTGRADIHEAFLAAVAAGELPAGKLPRRVVLFGVSALPYQTLQALAALARHTQVVLAVPNPCQYYWGDIIEGRDLLRASYKRQRQRNGHDLAELPLEALHAHSHPLLASWGRQGRDFIRMLDEFDEQAHAEGRDDSLRIDLFGEEQGETLLQQVQVAIRELRPLAEHEQVPPDDDDRSIEFHVAHSVQREVEVLHDQLLAMFAQQQPERPAPARRGGDGARYRCVYGGDPRRLRPAPPARSALYSVRDRRRQGPQRQSAAGGARMAAATAAAALPPERGARPARRAGAGRALRPAGR